MLCRKRARRSPVADKKGCLEVCVHQLPFNNGFRLHQVLTSTLEQLNSRWARCGTSEKIGRRRVKMRRRQGPAERLHSRARGPRVSSIGHLSRGRREVGLRIDPRRGLRPRVPRGSPDCARRAIQRGLTQAHHLHPLSGRRAKPARGSPLPATFLRRLRLRRQVPQAHPPEGGDVLDHLLE